jgi:toxin-antitoxin system PIN domain toxin
LKRGIDTNVLIYAHVPKFDEHAAVRRFLLGELADSERILVVTPMVLHEFVHVVTDGRRFEPPVKMAEALALAQEYLGRPNVECASVDEPSVREAFRLLEHHRLGPKRIADTLLVATLLRAGVREIITCDPKDFAIFENVVTIDPRE